MNTPPTQDQSSKPPPIPGRFAFEPMPEGNSPALLIEALLKSPGRIIHELQNNWRATLATWLLLLALLGAAAYGVVVGSFSGGAQLWIAPVKISMGTLLSILICLPSLYIFACLSGIDARLRAVAGVLFAAVALSALLLIGFAPVAWIFSIDRLSGIHGCAAHRVLGDRNCIWITFVHRNGALSDRLNPKSLETVGTHFRAGLPTNDDHVASDCRKIGAFSPQREEILSRVLGRNSSGRIIKKMTRDGEIAQPESWIIRGSLFFGCKCDKFVADGR
jgi:hypothetical protein